MRVYFYLFLVIIGLILVAGCSNTVTTPPATMPSFTPTPNVSSPNGTPAASPDVKELVAFVESAAAYAREHGKERAIEEFNNKTGQFVNGPLYIFGSDLDANLLINPYIPAWVGTNVMNNTDPNGVQYYRNEVEGLKEGNEFFYLVFTNFEAGNKDQLKLLYMKKMNDSWLISSGIYLPGFPATFDPTEKERLVAQVKEAQKYAQEIGKKNALLAFNDPKGNFTRDGRMIFAFDYNGTALALPGQRDLVGTDHSNITDLNGYKFFPYAKTVAQRGDGFMYLLQPGTPNMTQTLMLDYVADVDGTWFLGSGIPAKGGAPI